MQSYLLKNHTWCFCALPQPPSMLAIILSRYISRQSETNSKKSTPNLRKENYLSSGHFARLISDDKRIVLPIQPMVHHRRDGRWLYLMGCHHEIMKDV